MPREQPLNRLNIYWILKRSFGWQSAPSAPAACTCSCSMRFLLQPALASRSSPLSGPFLGKRPPRLSGPFLVNRHKCIKMNLKNKCCRLRADFVYWVGFGPITIVRVRQLVCLFDFSENMCVEHCLLPRRSDSGRGGPSIGNQSAINIIPPPS